MATATIYRPQCEINYTALPNQLFHHGEIGLKPRDASVLNYLLSKPEHWNINHQAIANALSISVSTVKRALSNLVKLGFALWERAGDGRTKWIIKLPESLGFKPQSQKPHQQKPHQQIETVLETNKNKEKTNKELQTEEPLPPVVLETLKARMAKGEVKNPQGYAKKLMELAKNGLLSANTQQPVQKPVDNQIKPDVDAKLKEICARSGDRIKADLDKKGFIHVKGYGNFSRDDLKPYLGVSHD